MNKRHLLAILLGIATVVLAGNLLNDVFGWDLSAILAGLFAGMEVGYWTGAPEITQRAHLKVLSTVFSKTTAQIMAKFLLNLACVVMLVITICGVYIITAHVTGWVQEWSIWGGMLSDDPHDLFLRKGLGAGGSLFVLFLIPMFLIDNPLHGNEFVDKLIKFFFIPLAGIGIGLALPFAILIGLPAIALVVAAVIIGVVIWLLTSLVILAGKQELATITVGVVIGGLAGLVYGQWTHLEIMPTLTAIAIGVITGLPAAYAVHRLGRARFLLRLMGKTEEAGA